MMIRLFLVLAAIAAVAPASQARQPNVIFILADDLGWRDTSFDTPHPFYETPQIERLARRGMRFTQASTANPLCSPTRASILTGLDPARIGLTEPHCHLPKIVLKKALEPRVGPEHKSIAAEGVTRLSTEYYTLAEAFKQAGYRTGHFGKWHLGTEPYSPLQHGFDVDVPHWNGPGPAGGFVAPWRYPAALNFTGAEGEHIEDRMAREAVDFIRTHREHPFYLQYWSFSVHAPIDAKPALIDKYRQKASRLGESGARWNPVYAAMIESFDDAVGRLLDTIDELKLTDDTIIVFLSDNGGVHWPIKAKDATSTTGNVTTNAPLRAGKATTYEGGTRVPAVVLWPGITRAHASTDSVIQSTDFFPTIAELLNLPRPAGHVFDGRSFAAALRGQPHERGPIFCHYPHNTPLSGGLASTYVRNGPWKLIRFYCLNPDNSDRLELYNLTDDPGEANNLAAQLPEKARELNELISAYLRDTEAVIPIANPNYGKKPTHRKPGSVKAPSSSLKGATPAEN